MFKKMFPLLLILLTVAYLSKDAWLPEVKKDKQTMVGTQFPVRVTAVSTGTLQEELKFPMELKALTEAKVIPNYLGRIEALYVQEGSVVKAGEPLYKYVGPQVGEDGFFDDLIVKSPITGVVLSVVKDVGAAVEKDKEVLILAPLGTMKVQVDIPSEYYSYISLGMKAFFTVDSYPGKKYSAVLRTISPQVESASRTVLAEFVFNNAEQHLLPGMAGTILIKNSAKVSGLLVPLESIFVLEGQQYVFVQAKGKAELRKIRILQEGVTTAVVAGVLHPGEQVLTTRSDTMKNGDELYVVK